MHGQQNDGSTGQQVWKNKMWSSGTHICEVNQVSNSHILQCIAFVCMYASHMPLCQHVIGNVTVPQHLSEQSIAKVILSLLKSLYYCGLWSEVRTLIHCFFCWCRQNIRSEQACVCVQNMSAFLTLLRSEESVLKSSPLGNPVESWHLSWAATSNSSLSFSYFSPPHISIIESNCLVLGAKFK